MNAPMSQTIDACRAQVFRILHAMMEHSSDAVVLVNPEREGVFYASPAVERITGYNLQELRAKSLLDNVHPEDGAMAQKWKARLLETPGLAVTYQTRMRHKDGSYRLVEKTGSNLLNEPSIQALVIHLRDVTDRKAGEQERARLRQRLRHAEKMETLGRFAGGIAHDFNNILGGIVGYSEMLAEQAPTGSLKRYATNVLIAARRARGLVHQILAYSRSPRGERVPVDLGGVVAETLELVRASLPEGIVLESDVPTAQVEVIGDATQFHQVLMNVCTNAIQAMANGGTLRVTFGTLETREPMTLFQSALQPGRYVALSVADSGVGMDEATMARIFEPFFTTKEVGQGTGLGLSLVYDIITDAGGAIEVSSRVEHGSTFTIYLPRAGGAVVSAD